MAKYAALIYESAANEGAQPDPEVWAKVMAEYNEFGEKNGEVIVGGEALHPTTTATTVVVQGGKGGDVLHTDGPFAEAKEVLTGFYLLEAADLDEALGLAAQIPGSWYGKVEVRPCIDFTQMG